MRGIRLTCSSCKGTEFKHYAPAESEAKYYYRSTYGSPMQAE